MPFCSAPPAMFHQDVMILVFYQKYHQHFENALEHPLQDLKNVRLTETVSSGHTRLIWILNLEGMLVLGMIVMNG